MKTVGIIGGLGPETTSEFYLDLVFSCQKKDKTARPPIILSSVLLPYQIEEDLILRSESEASKPRDIRRQTPIKWNI